MLYLHVLTRIRIPNTDLDSESSWIRIQCGSRLLEKSLKWYQYQAVFRIQMDPGFYADPDPDFKTRIRPFFALTN